MKVCFKCGESKSLTEFYKHKQMKDGHLNKCKSCAKKDSVDNRWKNIDRIREYDRNRGNRQGYEYVKNFRQKYPKKYAAYRIVRNYLRSGKITKPDKCELCGNIHSQIEGHHNDYDKPLDVMWLCSPCHKQWHRDNGEAKNAL